jgi:hypothetical protein
MPSPPMSAGGDIIYGGASGTGTRLAKGSDGQVLTLASGLPTWATAASGSSTTSTEWVSYTPTFVGAGTVTSIGVYWRRVGDSIEIAGNFTTGTATGVGFTMTLPGVLVTDNSGKIPARRVIGRAYLGDATSSRIKNVVFQAAANSSTITASNEEYSSALDPTVNQLGSSIFFNSSLYSIDHIVVPINGWTNSN